MEFIIEIKILPISLVENRLPGDKLLTHHRHKWWLPASAIDSMY
jgi:hypothetical protein